MEKITDQSIKDINNLPNCPFCGQEVFLFKQEIYEYYRSGSDIYYGVGCETENCYCGIDDPYHSTPEEAIEQWMQLKKRRNEE